MPVHLYCPTLANRISMLGTYSVSRFTLFDSWIRVTHSLALTFRIHRVANTAGQIGDELESLDRQRTCGTCMLASSSSPSLLALKSVPILSDTTGFGGGGAVHPVMEPAVGKLRRPL
jgi:hypothetical protein